MVEGAEFIKCEGAEWVELRLEEEGLVCRTNITFTSIQEHCDSVSCSSGFDCLHVLCVLSNFMSFLTTSTDLVSGLPTCLLTCPHRLPVLSHQSQRGHVVLCWTRSGSQPSRYLLGLWSKLSRGAGAAPLMSSVLILSVTPTENIKRIISACLLSCP